MKFLSSLIGGIILSVILLLLLGLFLKCDHANKIEVYWFQPDNSTAASHVKLVCEECNQGFQTTLFRDTSPNETYIDVIAEHSKDKKFVKGEYDTIKATVRYHDYDATETKISCFVEQGAVVVNFWVEFKGEYEDVVSSLQEGEEITFYGKSALKGLSWTDCELITE